MKKLRILSNGLWLVLCVLLVSGNFFLSDLSAQVPGEITAESIASDNLQSFAIFLIILSVSILSFFLGRLISDRINDHKLQHPRVGDIRVDPTLAAIIKEHKVLATILIVCLSLLIGYFVFWLAGENPEHLRTLNWGGTITLITIFLPAIIAISRIIRM